jgi:hypothetical protein
VAVSALLSDRTLDRVFCVRVRKFQRSRASRDADQDRQQSRADQHDRQRSGRYHRHLHDRQADVHTHTAAKVLTACEQDGARRADFCPSLP